LTQDIGGPLARSTTDLAIMLDATVGVDPADPSTKVAEGRLPKSYAAALTGATLKGVRIGTIPALFGNAPEDAEVTAVVRAALDRMRAAGAEVVDVTIPGFDALTAGTSTINAEFKHDLDTFLSAFPQAPVHSLGEILASGKFDPAVEGVLRRASMVETRDTDAYRQSLEKRTASRQAIAAALKAERLDALAYPTLRRKPAVIGQGQGGSNCQLSATTGLPAMSVPAGFSPDGLPIGLELLGDAFTESALLRIAYAYEQLASPRRPPRNMP
jgi:Asp-tRNA(Asn)/Glu-tRNA(Gln) amidotransferase A subunit family amidase